MPTEPACPACRGARRRLSACAAGCEHVVLFPAGHYHLACGDCGAVAARALPAPARPARAASQPSA